METLIDKLKKTKSGEDLNGILAFIKENSINDYNKHSKELIQFILGNNIDKEAQRAILLHYIDLFFSFSLKSEQLSLIPFEKIFLFNNPFYTEISHDDYISSFYEVNYPKDGSLVFSKGDKVDFLQIEDLKSSWTQGEIISVQDSTKQYFLRIPSTTQIQCLKFDSYRIYPLNTFTQNDFDWRSKLVEGDVIDALDSGNGWNKSTITSRTENTIQVTLRTYEDETKTKYLGYEENYDFTCSVYDSKIRQKGTYSFNIYFPNLYAAIPKTNSKFNINSLHIPFDNRHYIIPKRIENISLYSMEFLKISNIFISKLLECMKNEKHPIFSSLDYSDYFFLLCHILHSIHEQLHPLFAMKFIPEFVCKAQSHLLLFSKTDSRNFTKASILSVSQNLKVMMQMAYYPWEISSHVSLFEISFGLNCLGSKIMEKQLLGLKIISNTLNEGTKQYSSNEKLEAISALLRKDANGANIFDILFNSNFHSEIFKKSSEVILSLFKLKVINKEEIDQLHRLVHTTKINEIRQAIYEVLSKGALEMSSELIFHSINKLFEIKKEDITNEDIYLLVELSKNMPDNFWYETAVQVLDFLFIFIIEGSQDKLITPFCDLIKYSDKLDYLVKIFFVFFEKLINSLSVKTLYIQMMFLSKLFDAVPLRIEEDLIYKVSYMLFKSPEYLGQLIVDFCLNKENSSKIDILLFVMKIIEATKNNSIFSKDFIKSLFDFYTKENDKQKEFFISWLKNLQESHLLTNEVITFLFTLLKEYQMKQPSHSIDKILLNFFWDLFISINSLDQKYFSSNGLNPFELKYSDIIWELLINSENEESLINYYMEMFALPWIPQEERSVIWKQAILKTFSDMTAKNKKNCIKILISLIEVSDSFGNANSKPHSSLMESAELKLQFANEIDKSNNYSFDMTVSSSLTLYDLKALISKKIKIPIISFGICRFLDIEIPSKVNGRTLGCLFMDNSKLKLKKSEDLKIERKKLSLEGEKEFTPEVKKVYENIFIKFSSKGLMSREQACKYISDAFGGVVKINDTCTIVKNFFEKYDDNKDGFITLPNFLQFHYAGLESNGEEVLWKNLKELDYRYDLSHISEPYERKIYDNDQRELMPRYILSKNSQYYNQLFEMQSDVDTNVSDSANDLINILETNESLYNQILSNKSSDYLTNAKENIFQMIYVLQIISYIIKQVDKENEPKWIKTFVRPFNNNHSNKSTLEHMIDVFITQMSMLLDEKKTLLKLYAVQLQLIKICFESLVNSKDLNELLLHYEKELDSSIPIVNNEEISAALLAKPNLQLVKLVKLIADKTPILNNKDKFVDLKKDSLVYSFQILIIILLAYGENAGKELVGFELNEFLFNQLKIQFPFAQRLSYLTMKILFTQLKDKDDQIFKQNKELILREIYHNNADLNKYNPIYVFKLYQEVIKISQLTLAEKEQVIIDILNELTNASNIYTEDILIGYFSTLQTIISTMETLPEIIQEVLAIVINKFLINDTTNSYQFNSDPYVKSIFAILSELISKSSSILLLFYLNDKIKNLASYITKLPDDKKLYDTITECKSKIDYIGIKNLGSVCYLISVIQQFFFVRPFKYCINESPLPDDPDTPLYQLKKMFSYLDLSNRRDYSPHEFAHSFKDFEGLPIDIKDQFDAQEFLSRFLDKIELELNTTQFKYLLPGIFGGESCSQLFCHNPDCDKISNRFENLSYLSLEIKQLNSLDESLEKYISEERIDDFFCDKCKIKTTHLKRVSINKLPNVLIIHLQRIAFDYETFQMTKIDSKLEFPKELNLKNYCTENLQTAEIFDEDFNSHVYDREDEYYKYKLVGVVIHTGTAEFGHYFSLINVKTMDEKESWMLFNDSVVCEYQINKLEDDTFGGTIQKKDEWSVSNQNAYLLLYERQKKTRLACLIDKENEQFLKDKTVIEIKDDLQLNRELEDIFIKNDQIKADQNDKTQRIYCINKGGNQPKEYIDVIDYNIIIEKESKREKEQMIFHNEVMKDNIKFNNDRIIFTKHFTELIEVSAKQLHSMQDLKEDDVTMVYMKIHNIILSIISKSYFKENLQKIITELITTLKAHPKIILNLLSEIQASDDKWLFSYILVQDKIIGLSFSFYLSNIIIQSIVSNTGSDIAYSLIDYYLEFIPVQLSRKWNQMYYFLKIFSHLAKSKEPKVIEYLLGRETIKKMCDLFLGKESPFYKGDNRTEIGNSTVKAKYAPLLSTIANLLNFNPSYVHNQNDMKCLNMSAFYIKALTNEYHNPSMSKIISHLMVNNKEYTLERLEEMIPLINTTSSITNVKNIFLLIENILAIVDDYTLLRIENLIGIPHLAFEKRWMQFKYISPMMTDNETIIQKIIIHFSFGINYLEFTKSIYDLTINNPHVLNYVKDIPHMINGSKKNGLLKAIEDQCQNVIESFNLKNEAKYTEQIANIEELQLKIRNSLEENEKQLSEQVAESDLCLYVMNVVKEIVTKVDYDCNDDELKGSLILLRGKYDVIEIDKEAFNEQDYPDNLNFIDIDCCRYYLNNLSSILEGKPVTRELKSPSAGTSFVLIRYFIINTSNSKNQHVLLEFNSGNNSTMQKSPMTISIPKQSISEVLFVKEKNEPKESISIQSKVDKSIQDTTQPILALPSPSDISDVCTIVCQICGETNLIDNTDADLKCKACQVFLFQ